MAMANGLVECLKGDLGASPQDDFLRTRPLLFLNTAPDSNIYPCAKIELLTIGNVISLN